MKEITLKNNHFVWGNLLCDVLDIWDYDEQNKVESIRLVVLDPSGETKEVVLKNNNQIWSDICREILGLDEYSEVDRMDSIELTVDECESETVEEDQ